MRFNCGETWDEKLLRKKTWHLWFAWFPVKISDHDCRWLEYVDRSGSWDGGYDGGGWEYKYRPALNYP